VERLLIIGGLFVAAGLCEIGGGYLVWGWMRDDKPLAWALMGALVLAAYGVVAALQPISEFGRVYAAYGGIFIALALLWGSSWTGSGQTGGTCWEPRSAWREWW
jgi:small multidrug resistance family-3 protein